MLIASYILQDSTSELNIKYRWHAPSQYSVS